MSALKVREKTRVQLDLSPRQLERLNRIMEATEAETRKDLFNDAMSFYEWGIGEVLAGREIASVDLERHDIVRLSTPRLENVKQWVKQQPDEAQAAMSEQVRRTEVTSPANTERVLATGLAAPPYKKAG